MSRIRTIKPEFWSDEKISEVSRDARLLFIGMWNYADDYGNIERSAKQMKARIFPYDEIDCEILLNELITVGLVIEYSVMERKYLHVRNFTTHQKIDKPSKARFPYPPGNNYGNVQIPLDEGSPLEGKGKEWSGRERKGKGKDVKEGEDGSIEEPPKSALPDPTNSSIVVMTIENLREQMLGQMFIENSSIALHTDIDTFRRFVEDWCNEKELTYDFMYPIGRLKGFLISDFKRQKKGGFNNVKGTKMDNDEILRLAEKKAKEEGREGGAK